MFFSKESVISIIQKENLIFSLVEAVEDFYFSTPGLMKQQSYNKIYISLYKYFSEAWNQGIKGVPPIFGQGREYGFAPPPPIFSTI